MPDDMAYWKLYGDILNCENNLLHVYSYTVP